MFVQEEVLASEAMVWLNVASMQTDEFGPCLWHSLAGSFELLDLLECVGVRVANLLDTIAWIVNFVGDRPLAWEAIKLKGTLQVVSSSNLAYEKWLNPRYS